MARHLVVVGLMGSGKTTLGKALAGALGWRHRDSDAELEAAHGRTARAIGDDIGIERLHELELGLLLDALAAPGPSVISAAASTIDEPDGRAALAEPGVFVAWLRIDPASAARRARPGDHRPKPEDLAVQAARRDPLFAAVADVVLDALRPVAGNVQIVLDRLPGGAAAERAEPAEG
jgi:shikimate kinase